MASTAERVRIHYLRPPARAEIFEQEVLSRTGECVVTFLESATIDRPVFVDARPILEPGAPIVWFTFADRWHDIGRFHSADGTFQGLYANILTPVHGLDSTRWTTTDLFLDVWQEAGGGLHLLDRDELEEAVRAGAVEASLARRAEDEAKAILEAARNGVWPPRVVAEWPLERALELLGR